MKISNKINLYIKHFKDSPLKLKILTLVIWFEFVIVFLMIWYISQNLGKQLR